MQVCAGELPPAVAEKAANRKHSPLVLWISAKISLQPNKMIRALFFKWHAVLFSTFMSTTETGSFWPSCMRIGSKQKVIGPRAASITTAWRRASSRNVESTCTCASRMLKRSTGPALPRASGKARWSWRRPVVKMKSPGIANTRKWMMRHLVFDLVEDCVV